MNKPKNFHWTPNQMTGKRSVKPNLSNNKENKGPLNSPTVFTDIFNNKFYNFATTAEVQPYWSLNNIIN